MTAQAAILAPVSLFLLALGGFLVWPIAYRRGIASVKREAAELEAWNMHWTPEAVEPGRHRMTAQQSRHQAWGRVRDWWQSTAPRDPRQLFGDDVVAGRPPAELAGRAA